MSEKTIEQEMQNAVDDLPLAKRLGESVGGGFYFYNGACVVDIHEHLEARGIPHTRDNAVAAYREIQQYFLRRGKKTISAADGQLLASDHALKSGTVCAHCGKRMDAATNQGGVESPVEGDPCICICCGEFNIMLADGSFRKATDEETAKILANAANARDINILRKRIKANQQGE